MCLICNQPQGITPFCLDHQKGWVQSEERRAVDFSLDESYVEQIFRYVERFEKENEAQIREIVAS